MKHIVQSEEEELGSPVIVTCDIVMTFFHKLDVINQRTAGKLVVNSAENQHRTSTYVVAKSRQSSVKVNNN